MRKNDLYIKGDEVFGVVTIVGRKFLTILISKGVFDRWMSKKIEAKLPINKLLFGGSVKVGDQVVATVVGKKRGYLILDRR
jgi:hypothetical protein